MNKIPFSSTPRAWQDGIFIYANTAHRLWRLHRSEGLDELWENMSDEDFADEKIPYWTELWPSSLVLAEWLSACREDIYGHICIDLGCGLGLTALAGQYLGAKVLAVDYEMAALRACMENSVLNNIKGLQCAAMDWRTPAIARKSIYRVWAGDIIYEKRFMEPIRKFLDKVLMEDGAAWIAEPGRTIFYNFLDELGLHGFTAQKVYCKETAAVQPQKALIQACIWEIRRSV